MQKEGVQQGILLLLSEEAFSNLVRVVKKHGTQLKRLS